MGDRIIIAHQGAEPISALFSVRNDGSGWVPIADQVYTFEPVHSTGAFVCYVRDLRALWCVPADGSAVATKVTDYGEFVMGL